MDFRRLTMIFFLLFYLWFLCRFSILFISLSFFSDFFISFSLRFETNHHHHRFLFCCRAKRAFQTASLLRQRVCSFSTIIFFSFQSFFSKQKQKLKKNHQTKREMKTRKDRFLIFIFLCSPSKSIFPSKENFFICFSSLLFFFFSVFHHCIFPLRPLLLLLGTDKCQWRAQMSIRRKLRNVLNGHASVNSGTLTLCGQVLRKCSWEVKMSALSS